MVQVNLISSYFSLFTLCLRSNVFSDDLFLVSKRQSNSVACLLCNKTLPQRQNINETFMNPIQRKQEDQDVGF